MKNNNNNNNSNSNSNSNSNNNNNSKSNNLERVAVLAFYAGSEAARQPFSKVCPPLCAVYRTHDGDRPGDDPARVVELYAGDGTLISSRSVLSDRGKVHLRWMCFICTG